MKKPLFNQFERQVMRNDDSLYASTMLLHIAKKKFEKAFMKTYVGLLFEKYLN
jgi:hypothetical protein